MKKPKGMPEEFQMNLQTGKPLVIKLTSNYAFSDVSFLNAYLNAGAVNSGLPKVGDNKITGTTGTPTVTYEMFLQNLKNSAYRIKKILVVSNNQTLLQNPLTVTHYTTMGESASNTEVFTPNVFQGITSQVEIPVNFWMDGRTTMTINGTFPANRSVEYHFYFDKSYEKSIMADYGKSQPVPIIGYDPVRGRVPEQKIRVISNRDIL